jgi:hypothetical protein
MTDEASTYSTSKIRLAFVIVGADEAAFGRYLAGVGGPVRLYPF